MKSGEISEIEKYYNIELRLIIEDEREESKVMFHKNENTYSLNSKNEIQKLNLKDNNLGNLDGLSKIKNTVTDLNLGATRIDNIEILSDFKNLVFLDLSTNQIEDINPIKALKKLEYLYLDNNKINKIPELNLPNLHELWLYSNNIEDISNLKLSLNLYSINISNNKIENINVLSQLRNLKVVDLSKNKICEINVLNNFKSFNSLRLSSNTINDISAFSNFESIEILDLKNNQIEDITPLKSIAIEELFIGENSIIDLTPLYSSLKAKKIGLINVNNSPILLYPIEEIAKRGEERIVEWFDMVIENCNQKINKFKQNDENILDLGMMGLTDLSLIPKLFELENLEELILSNVWADYNEKGTYWERENSNNNFYINNIYNIPSEIKNLKNLKKLIIGGDWKKDNHWNRWRIKDITPLFSLNKLEYLNASNNVIERIVVRTPPKLINLKILHLNNNKLNTFYTLTKFPNLEELYLSNNELTTVNNLKNLTTLKTVDLHSNKITTLKPLINLLKKTSINITDTKWEKNTINIKENPIKQPNFETILNGKEAIIRYFESDWKKIINKEVKLILVGNSEVGKTTLVKYLDGEKDLDSTHEATHWMIEKDVTSKQIIKKLNDKCNLRVFDFGGQDYYHDTHQIFFTGNTVYLLLWEEKTNGIYKRNLEQTLNGKKRSIITQDYPVEYWLESIKHFTKIKSNILDEDDKIVFEYDSKTLVIQNKVSKSNEISQLNNAQLTSKIKYPFIYDFININIKNGKRNLVHFDFLLTDIINEMEKVGEEVLEYQHIIRNDLKTYNAKPILSFNEFIEYCNSKLYKNINNDEAKDLCIYLQHIGLIFYLPNFSNIYIDKDWVFKCIHTTLDGLFETEGEFNEEYIEEIIKKVGGVLINSFIKDSIIELMLEHKIIFKNLTSNKYIAPLYLPNEPLEGVNLFLLENKKPYRRFEYNGFIHKTFILDFYSKYGSKTIGDGKKFYYWKDGLIIKDESTGQILHIKYNNVNENDMASVDIFKLNETDKLNVFASEVINSIKDINNRFFQIDKKDMEEKRVDIVDYYEEMVTVDNKDFVSYALIQKNNEERKFVFSERKLIDLKENKISLKKNINLIDYKQFIEKKDMINKIFISYSKKDLGMVNVFQDHLSALERDKLLNTWYCTELKAGEDWDESIQNHFNESNIICFMISPNFMKTDYIFEYEVKKALERKRKGDDNFIIVPIIMDFCIWTSENENYNLGKYTALPYTVKPVTDFDNQNAAWLIIAECIKILIKERKQPDGEDFFSKNNYYKNNQLRDLFERLVKGELNKKNK